jgi:ribose-phosphate pyrophosphokinase
MACANDYLVFAGTASRALAGEIARELGGAVAGCTIERFPDGEVSVRLLEPVCRRHVFLIQSTSPPVNDHLMELLVLADACRRAAAERITAVVPYMGYARADKQHGRREAITARVVADLLQAVGVTHVVTMDLHTPQIEGFFNVPVDALTAVPTLSDTLRERLPRDAVVVSPDRGRVSLATQYAACLGTSVVVLHKRRDSGTETEVTHIVGDVAGRSCLVIDDMISTAGTMAQTVRALLSNGARPDIVVAATHGLFLRGAREKLDVPAVRDVFVTDTVETPAKDWPKLHVVSIAPLIAAALSRFLGDSPASGLHVGRIGESNRGELT